VTDRTSVSRWVAAYEEAWRTPGTERLARLFTLDATYRHSPYEAPIVGLDDIRQMWEDDRDSAQEIFTMATEIVAVEGLVAVVRAEVRYGDPVRQEYRDLWVVRFDDAGRCREFEEWPFWPGRPYSAEELPIAQNRSLLG
jgi:ketosteroid isomerase-like protein